MGFSIGGVLNSITGVTNSAAQAQGYALQNAAVNNAYQKEFAQNGVQWRAADLEKAGFNRALAATGGAATASGGGSFGGSTGSSSGINPIGLIGSLVEMKNQTNATNAQTKVADAQAIKLIAETRTLPEKLRIQLISALAEQKNAETNAEIAKGGLAGKVFGTENGGTANSILTAIAPFVGGGIAGGGYKAYKAYKAMKTAKGFSNFLNALKK